MSKLTIRVLKQEAGMKLLAFLRLHCPEGVSVRALKRAVDAKQCRINGRIQTVSTTPLKAMDQVVIELAMTEKREMVILFEDEDLLVVNKPAMLVCDKETINAQLPQYLGKLELIHRLDKETSGVLLIAKNLEFREKMVHLFKQKGVKKTYYAIVDGVVEGASGKCANRLGKLSGHSNQAVWGSVKGRGGKEAITLWKRLKTGHKACFMQLEPLTGRTHQLRVHMSEMGHTILGDVQYRGKKFYCYYQPHRNLLHAFSIEFIHPITEKKVHFEMPIPNDFNVALNKLF